MKKQIFFDLIKKANVIGKDKYLVSQCENKHVLDVGCVGQTRGYATNEWLFDKYKTVAKSVTGVDVNMEGVEVLKREGYNVVTTSELETLGQHYDIIIMSDVIEHIDNPGAFLEEYSRYLGNNGRMIVTTPNATRARTFFEILFSGHYSLNLEHTMWFCPKTLVELIGRTSLMPVEFYWLKEYGYDKYRSVSNFLAFILSSLLCVTRKKYNPNFMIILEKKNEI